MVFRNSTNYTFFGIELHEGLKEQAEESPNKDERAAGVRGGDQPPKPRRHRACLLKQGDQHKEGTQNSHPSEY